MMDATSRISIFIVDDHALFREGLLRLLEASPRLRIAGQAGSMREALDMLDAVHVDVLVLDYDLGEGTALTLVRQLRERERERERGGDRQPFAGRILLVTAGLPAPDALELVRLGISGIVHKQHSPDTLVSAILDAAAGKLSIEPAYLQTILSSATSTREEPTMRLRLTDREREVLRLLLEGCSNKEIAARLHASESGVKASLQQLFTKTGVRTRSQLVRIALETTVLDAPV